MHFWEKTYYTMMELFQTQCTMSTNFAFIYNDYCTGFTSINSFRCKNGNTVQYCSCLSRYDRMWHENDKGAKWSPKPEFEKALDVRSMQLVNDSTDIIWWVAIRTPSLVVFPFSGTLSFLVIRYFVMRIVFRGTNQVSVITAISIL